MIRCIVCLRESEREVTRACSGEYSLCGPWEAIEASLNADHAALMAAHAAGYAAAVADIRQTIVDALAHAEPMTKGDDIETLVTKAAVLGLEGLVEQIDIGAHVGAAKKGVT